MTERVLSALGPLGNHVGTTVQEECVRASFEPRSIKSIAKDNLEILSLYLNDVKY